MLSSVEDKGKFVDMMLGLQWFAEAIAQLSQIRNSSQWPRLSSITLQIHYMSDANIRKELDYQGHSRVVGETGFLRLIREVSSIAKSGQTVS